MFKEPAESAHLFPSVIIIITHKRLCPDSIRDSIQIRIAVADLIRDSIRTKISDLQVPSYYSSHVNKVMSGVCVCFCLYVCVVVHKMKPKRLKAQSPILAQG